LENASYAHAAIASIFNISPSTVRKWEQGEKKPAGASRKLLDLMERKGIEVLI
jgi:putative transcriptional regulator